jgi:hypothetical protein
MLMAAGLYHWVFLKGARERWPVFGTLVRLVVQDEFEQRDRFMRENLDAMARKLGEMQAKHAAARSAGRARLRPGRRQSRRAQGGRRAAAARWSKAAR